MASQRSFDSQYFVSNIMTKLVVNLFPQGRIPHARRLHLHLDNYRIHFSKVTEQFITQNQILSVSHPSYSPDIAPSDFWLFDRVKNSLAGRTFDEPEQLLEAITECWIKFSPQNWNSFSATGSRESGGFWRTMENTTTSKAIVSRNISQFAFLGAGTTS
jgi:transposase